MSESGIILATETMIFLNKALMNRKESIIKKEVFLSKLCYFNWSCCYQKLGVSIYVHVTM